MTGPTDPGDDWGFPEVDPADTTGQEPGQPAERAPDAGPASTSLPEPEEPVFDTGSDAWWRQQAAAQRQAAAGEPVVPPVPPAPPAPLPPPDLVEPEVLTTPSPLDEDWLPPELPQEPEPVAEHRPSDAPDWYRDLVEPASVATAAAPMPEEEPVPVEESARTRQPYEGERVGPGRALAGAALALLGVLLAIGALILFNGNDEPKGGPVVAAGPTSGHSSTPSAAPSAEPTATPSTGSSPAPVVVATKPAAAPVIPVTVLNNSRRTGFASQAAAYFERNGWPVRTTGNYRGRIEQTTVYYAPGQEGSARRFAAQFHVPRVLPRSALPGLPSTGMTVVLTRDYTF